jgi:putative addiction module component (TIGR02574 family)
MNPAAEELLTIAFTLPADERLEIAEALLASLQPHNQPPFDESWPEVIRRRSEEVRSGKVTPIPWAEVKRQARGAAGG